MVASVAPSAPAYFAMTSFGQMEQALAGLGFAAAGETALGAEMVGQAHGELVGRNPAGRPIIASSCPVVVNLIEQYYPDLIPHLAPLVSPMIAHGRYLRQLYGPQAFIVFIGPCIAKKGEAADPAVAGAIDAVLTYTELEQWLAEAGSVPCGRRPALMPRTVGPLRPSPASAGSPEPSACVCRTATSLPARGRADRHGAAGHRPAVGPHSHRLRAGDLPEHARGHPFGPGPGLPGRADGLRRRLHQRSGPDGARHGDPLTPAGHGLRGAAPATRSARQRAEWPSLERTYRDRSVPLPEFSEEQIREVLHQVDKYLPEDELNCGSCGYPTCREKAIATLRGMAEATMCIPYMRARAESLNNVVMDATPNAHPGGR